MFVDMGEDEFGRKLKAINQMYGSIGVGDANVRLSLAAKTLKPEDAQALEEMLAGLQMIGKGFLRDGKGANNKVYARMLENARITRAANQVMLDLQVPQGDINILLLGQK